MELMEEFPTDTEIHLDLNQDPELVHPAYTGMCHWATQSFSPSTPPESVPDKFLNPEPPEGSVRNNKRGS